MASMRPKDLASPPSLLDPAALQILLVDASETSRAEFSELLQECHYQVTSCGTSKEALDILRLRKSQQSSPGFDLILKDHCPVAGTNACRLLKKAKSEPVLQEIPIIVVSTTEDRDVMVNCLQLGAADFMIKPLRLTELRNLWARVYWWRKALYLMQHSSAPHAQRSSSLRSQLSESSLDTKEDRQGDLARNMEQRSGEGSAPNEGLENGSRENVSKGLGSNNASKEGNVGWSRNQAKPGHGTSGEGMGNSADNPGPMLAAVNGAIPIESQGKKPSDESTKSRPGSSSLATGTAMGDTPFKSTAAQAPALTGGASHSTLASKTVAPTGPPGFRAYVASDNRKRSPGCLQGEPRKQMTSVSGRAMSMEYPPEKMRRTVSRLGSGSVQTGAGEAAFQNLQRGMPAGNVGLRTASGETAGLNRPSSNGQPSIPQQGQEHGDAATDVSFNPYYPFGMVPNPYTLAQLWGQANSQQTQQQQQPGNDMSQFLARVAQQGQAAAAQSNQQQQQMALHNHLMLQHSLLMQQYSMPLNPFANLPVFGTQEASQQRTAQTNTTAPQMPLRPQAEVAKLNMNGMPKAQGSGRQWEAASQDQKAGLSHAWRGKSLAEQSFPSAGKRTETGTATGCSLATHGQGTTTGATSHTTAQVGLDGCLIEPSQQERRAQALHKYKQKRKNLCFTKKIRYESRKQLAQARPRVKGQFVRVGEPTEASGDLDNLAKEIVREDLAMIPTFAREKKPVEKKLLDILATAEGEKAKDTDEDDTAEDELYEEDTESMSPTCTDVGEVKDEAQVKGLAHSVPVIEARAPLSTPQQPCNA